MICNRCNQEGVRNQVLGKEFYYCRTCKDEIYLQPKQSHPAENYELINLELDLWRDQFGRLISGADMWAEIGGSGC